MPDRACSVASGPGSDSDGADDAPSSVAWASEEERAVDLAAGDPGLAVADDFLVAFLAPGLDPQDDWAGPARPPFQSPTARRRLQPLKFCS